MKKFFIALSVLAALMLSVVPSQALVGTPDDVPGCDAIVPFIADISGSGLNTLFVFMDAGGTWVGTAAAPLVNFHYTVNTVRSVTVHDGSWKGTARDVISSDANTILAEMSVASRKALEVDIDGDGAADHYAGYMYVEGRNGAASIAANGTVGQFYLVNLAAGKAAAANIPMKEYSTLAAGAIVSGAVNVLGNMVSAAGVDVNMELFSATALVTAKSLQAGGGAVNSTNFAMYPRIFIPDSEGVNWMMYWLSENDIFASGVVHVNVYNADEGVLSTNIPLDNEWHIYDAMIHLPSGLWTAYPYEGFIDMSWNTTTSALRTLEALGWVYQQASGTAQEAWTVLTPMWRDAN